jgi:hypothetical protein
VRKTAGKKTNNTAKRKTQTDMKGNIKKKETK